MDDTDEMLAHIHVRMGSFKKSRSKESINADNSIDHNSNIDGISNSRVSGLIGIMKA